MDKPKRVFLIDDDEDDCYILDQALKEFDNPVELISEQDSEIALISLSANTIGQPDLFILDWNMPKVSGKQCLERIRNMPQFANVPIIVLSTSQSPFDKDEAEVGGAHFYSKPASIESLSLMLQEIFEEFGVLHK
jgi:CheY-like chemotaxis protein